MSDQHRFSEDYSAVSKTNNTGQTKSSSKDRGTKKS
jgi:hypothetical protein